ncbi:helix-turn-helix domain-containing protein [Falsiroseomonas sp. HW251]|uniref:helix-turn-helix domain-containing protein n=1 Tax=Falsiroseomonas sp. HW251 TaxID=3390998 RepID=UPI003D316285
MDTQHPNEPGANALPGGLHRAIAFLRTDLGRPLIGRELARAAGLPERTLRAHFRRFLGVSAQQWLHKARLTAIREALLAPQANETVGAAATRFGIAHLARFAADYRRRFGEPPSATLERGRAAVVAARMPAASLAGRGPPVLVLPVACSEGTARREDCDFAEALAEQLAMALSRIRSGPVRLVRPGERVVADAGSACYALAGRVVRSGDRLRVVLRLFDATDGTHVWGDAFDGMPSDALSLQDEVLGAAATMHGRIEDAATERAWRLPPERLLARDLVMRAISLIRASGAANNESAFSIAMRAAELDPTDAAAAALIGACYARRVGLGASKDWAGDRAMAIRWDARAAALDPSEPLSLAARSIVAMHVSDAAAADLLTSRAVAISPGSSWAWERSGYYHVASGNAARGIRHIEHAIGLNGPRAPISGCLNSLAQAHLWEGRTEQAAALALKSLSLNPQDVVPRRILSSCYALLGLDDQARRNIDHLRTMTPEISQRWFVNSSPWLAWSATRAQYKARVGDRLVVLGMPR